MYLILPQICTGFAPIPTAAFFQFGGDIGYVEGNESLIYDELKKIQTK